MDFEYRCTYVDKPSGPGPNPAKVRRVDSGQYQPTSGLSPGSENLSVQSMSPNVNGTGGRTFVAFTEQPGIGDPVKAKFWTSYSAIAFPRLLGAEFSPENAPRLHCFAWNVGVRPEEPEAEANVTVLLTLEECRKLSAVYFDIVHPEIGFLDRAVYEEKCTKRWSQRSEDCAYDCVICGVACLGSFFLGADGHPNEARLQRTVKEVVQSSSVIYYPSINHIAAWILRTIYLRLTTRPNGSWLSSCALTHILESTGIYKDQGYAPFNTPVCGAGIDETEIEYRRRLFWIGWSLNAILGTEYGRTKIELDVTCQKPRQDKNISMPFILIGEMLRPKFIPAKKSEKAALLMSLMDNLCDLQVDSDFQNLLKTDMIFSLYRRLRLLQFRLSKISHDRILVAGTEALEAASRLANRRLAWWNILSTPFQFVCVCLAIDSPEGFSAMKRAVAVLENVASLFDTHMVREGLQTAHSLVKLARDRKADDLRRLEACMPAPTSPDVQSSDAAVPGLDDPMLWSWADDSFAWDLILPSDKETQL